MPIVQIHLLKGRTVEQKRALVKRVTDAVSETVNAPPEAVEVIISEMERENYPKVIPDVVIEIVSEYDSYAAQRRKTERYVRQGAVYGVVIDPERRKVEEFGARPEGLVLDFDRINRGG